jgi:hypothetical protein
MTSRCKRLTLLAVLMSATLMPTIDAHADHGHGGFGFGTNHYGGGERGGGGHWIHGPHNGAWGWWWVLPGAWLLYDQPVYPSYPQVVVQPAPQEPMVIQPAPQTTQQNWYFCDSASTYYPYIQQCPEGWRTVPAVPPPSDTTTPGSTP